MDYANAPVTEPYAMDMMVEVQRLLSDRYPLSNNLIFVEDDDFNIDFGLLWEHDVVLYNPTLVLSLSQDDLVEVMTEVCIVYIQRLEESLTVPLGTTLH